MEIITLVLLLLCIVSCTNENVIDVENYNAKVNSQKKTFDPKYIDQVFSEYVKSFEYQNLKVNKDKYYSNFKNISFFLTIKSEKELKEWFRMNISETSFVNIEEALFETNNLIELKRLEVEKFPDVYEFIAYAPADIVDFTLERWLGNGRFVNTDYSCDEKLVMCENRAWGSYRRSIGLTLKDYGLSSDDALFEMQMTDNRFESDIRSCALSYELCEDKM